jgi:pyridinium-3,5-bisthiocarboxylic acid mononucleotide nickel chelatase
MTPEQPDLPASETSELLEDEIVLIETNLDNTTGESLGWLMDHLLNLGALDVSYTPMQMKKNRPAVLVRIIARPEDARRFAIELVRSTPTLGVRMMPMHRMIAGRRHENIATPWGEVAVKLKLLAGEVVDATVEYEDRRYLADKLDISLETITAQLNIWLWKEYRILQR